MKFVAGSCRKHSASELIQTNGERIAAFLPITDHFRQRIYGCALIRIEIEALRSHSADPSPLPYECRAAEQVGLNGHRVKAPFIQLRSNTPKTCRKREQRELGGLMQGGGFFLAVWIS